MDEAFLIDFIQNNGTYVIEDIQRQANTLSFISYLASCVNYVPDDFNLAEWTGLSRFDEYIPWLVHNTVGVACYRYMAFIDRGFNPRDNKFLIPLEEYRAHKDKEMDKTVEEMKAKDIPITRETLLENLHPNNRSYIDRLMSRLDL